MFSILKWQTKTHILSITHCWQLQWRYHLCQDLLLKEEHWGESMEKQTLREKTRLGQHQPKHAHIIFPFSGWAHLFLRSPKSNQQCFLHRRQPCDMKRRHQPWCWMLEGTSASSVCHLWDGSWVRWICYECRMTEWASTEICENFPSWPTLRLSVSVTQ